MEKQHQSIETEREFPRNILVLATHGSYYIPREIATREGEKIKIREKLRADLRGNILRLLGNFSDFRTRRIIPKDIPKSQKVIAGFSRAIGDPNRARDAADLFRETDFNGVPIWKEELTSNEKEALLERYYDEYHSRVKAAIEEAETENERVIIFDLHDTGNLMLKPNPAEDSERKDKFPEICLGDKDGTACDPEIMEFFAAAVEKNLGIKPHINTPYKGGYITTKYGKEYNDGLPLSERFKRNVIQIELGRYLYMDEKTQKIDKEKARKIQKGLEEAMREVGEKYGG
ncbi:MAG: N-formylglutamate amidohydrolase [Candidatus Gracilibacteria bacterium]|nr:N-formylglutamate amidohydrolase [Candidatus Gracilibacteria bacterium]MDD5178756.1 N-formylglutamate amidohydrolase [Candidatus Gracilibacteria bacterium]